MTRDGPVHDVVTFTMADMAELGGALRREGAGAETMEAAAGRIVRRLYADLRSGRTEARACALVRFYKTHAYEALPVDARRFAQGLAGGTPLADGLKCLTLLATIGDDPAWNTVSTSRGHRCIPLVSADMVHGAPMIAQLVAQLGLEVQTVLAPDPAFLGDLGRHTCNVFYVPAARGSPYIPAQDFVLAHGIASVLGFGGMLPSGNLFAIILFMKVHVPAATADMFKTLALNAKLAVLPLDAAVFSAGGPS